MRKLGRCMCLAEDLKATVAGPAAKTQWHLHPNSVTSLPHSVAFQPAQEIGVLNSAWHYESVRSSQRRGTPSAR